MKPVYNIPAGLPFADTLARGLLAEAGDDPLALAHMRIFLPTRRACRTLRESFLRLTGGRPLLLPRMQPIGDIEDDDPALLAGAELAVPPAMPGLRRQLLLARHIMAAPALGAPRPGQAMALAAALARLLDQVHTEGRAIESLQHLVPGDETHWQVTVKFLKVLSEGWPALLRAEGAIDAADRRNRLIAALTDSWRAAPPSARIIAAGTTGSIPATAALLAAIADLPRGAVVLPGLDADADDASWAALDDTHPQATLRRLLQQLGVARGDVGLWPGADAAHNTARRWLAAEMTRPAATSDKWQELAPSPALRAALAADIAGHVDLYEAGTPHEEARLVAAIIRHTVETPRQTVAVITPDRRLARRIAAVCRRWDIAVDDSAGQDLAASPAGGLLRLAARAAAENMRPAPLLALLRHPLCALGLDDPLSAVCALETGALRGPMPPPGTGGLRARLAAKMVQHDNPAFPLIDALDEALVPFAALLAGGEHPLPALAEAHCRAAEALAATAQQTGAARLWAGEDGAAAAGLMAGLIAEGGVMAPLTGAEYVQMTESLLAGMSVRRPAGLHPRIFILGQLEARLVQADITILAGLNEGVWPPAPAPDPWLSRPLRQQAGLPSPERSIGLSAHDFVQGFCAPRVIMTRARRQDGTGTVPARWLQRLDTVLRAAGLDPALLAARADDTPDFAALARTVDTSPAAAPQPQPAPAPPLRLRPRDLSVTEVETWLRNPYAIYARHVLRLQKLEPLEKPPDAAARGTLLHDALSDFVENNPDTLPPDAARQLYDRGVRAVAARADDPGFWEFWLPRYAALCDWFAAQEGAWRAAGLRPLKTECRGRMELAGPAGPFRLRVRADRVDRLPDGRVAAIDYKSGNAAAYSPARIAGGELPQLPLTALIIAQGGMDGVPAADCGYLGYWVLTGATPPGEIKSLSDDISAVTAQAHAGLAALIAAFDDPATPYIAAPRAAHAPDYDDYDHLARAAEWGAAEEAA